MNIKEDPHLIDFLENRNLKPATIDQYTKQLTQYCKYTGLTPTQLIEEAEYEEEERIRMKNRKIKKHIQQYIQHLKKENKSPNYITNSIGTIKTFYREFEIELPHIRCNIRDEDKLITIKDIPTKDDIKKALKYANLKYKAVIKLMMSSGMGSAEVRHLTIDDYLKAHKIMDYNPLHIDETIHKLQQKENNIPIWSIRRIKTGMPYVTFSSPESNHAINEYLEDRFDKQEITSKNDILFSGNDGNITNVKSFSTYFGRLNDTAGLGFYGRQRFFRSHSLRKFFASTLKNNKFDSLDAEWLIGHKVGKITDAYIKPDIYRLKKDYIDVLPYLSIEDVKTRTIESDEVKEIKETHRNEIEEMKKEIGPLFRIAELIDEDPELQRLIVAAALKREKKLQG